MDVKKTNLYKEFIAQRDEILKHKWYESERVGHDIGFAQALIDWTMRFKSKWIQERHPKDHKPNR
jgi:hypothetical protein